ncbi:hypothetical protein WME89_19105 [Sorangium sp. So ce321]|uniref:hypothetical protein n=1 Tax=Sorangium sp. So ce321 TaxID=3133300 RepID=UPI003F5EC233
MATPATVHTDVTPPSELAGLRLPEAVDRRPQAPVDEQDRGEQLPADDAEGLLDVAELLALLRLRASMPTRLFTLARSRPLPGVRSPSAVRLLEFPAQPPRDPHGVVVDMSDNSRIGLLMVLVEEALRSGAPVLMWRSARSSTRTSRRRGGRGDL